MASMPSGRPELSRQADPLAQEFAMQGNLRLVAQKDWKQGALVRLSDGTMMVYQIDGLVNNNSSQQHVSKLLANSENPLSSEKDMGIATKSIDLKTTNMNKE